MLEQAITSRPAVEQAQNPPHIPTVLDRVHSYRSRVDPDADLVNALRSRNPGAFDYLVERHERRLLGLALRITKNREDAEDVVQESFLNVFRRLDSFRGDSQFASWLTRITINQALMKIRGNTHKFVSLDEETECEGGMAIREIKSSGYTPEQIYAQREFENAIRNFATSVRKSSRRVMELYIEEDLSELEVAQLMRLSLSAVKARLHRGRQDLRDAMSKHFPLPNRSRLRRIALAATYRTRSHEETQPLAYILRSGKLYAESSTVHASV